MTFPSTKGRANAHGVGIDAALVSPAGTLSGCSVVLAAVREAGAVKGFDFLARVGLKREVRAARALSARGWALRGRDVELIGPDVVGALAADGHAERLEHGAVESLARFEVTDDELNVIE